jgi:hypothetical protein
LDNLFSLAVRNAFTRVINVAKDFIADPLKNMNKLNKDDKVIYLDKTLKIFC